MNSLTAALCVLAFLLVALPAAHRLILHWQRRESVRARIIRAAHERAEFAGLVDQLATDPEFTARLNQLRGLIRDEQNNTKGDQ